MAIPAALFLRRFNYKRSILVGLALYVLGCFLFIPAGSLIRFELFLLAYVVMTSGLSFLETTANPYILSLGPQETATRRLNFAQAFNPIGSLTGILIAKNLILSKLEKNTDTLLETLNKLSPEQLVKIASSEKLAGNEAVKAALDSATSGTFSEKLLAYYNATPLASTPKSESVRAVLEVADGSGFVASQSADLGVIMFPYLVLGVVVAGVLAFFFFARLPGSETECEKIEDPELKVGPTLKRLLKNGAYLQGVVVQAFYVGVQIMCWTFIIQYAVKEFGISKAVAQDWNKVAMITFVSSRFICTYLLKYVSPGGLLAALAMGGGALILGVMFIPASAGFAVPFGTGLSGNFLPLSLASLVAVSACMSLMFPTIYGIALRDLGDDAKLGSAGLILAIGGGAIFTPIQGWIIDQKIDFLGLNSIRFSFVVALVCFIVIAAYGLRTKLVHHAAKAPQA
jgi:FHS family L-fucose permease-like MFS transporter